MHRSKRLIAIREKGVEMKFIKKLLQRFKDENVYKIHQIIYKLQDFYLEKNQDPDVDKQYSKTQEEMLSMGITQLKLRKNIFVFCKHRLNH